MKHYIASGHTSCLEGVGERLNKAVVEEAKKVSAMSPEVRKVYEERVKRYRQKIESEG